MKYEERLCPAYNHKAVYAVEEELEVAQEESTVLAEVVTAEGKREVKNVPMFADRFITIE